MPKESELFHVMVKKSLTNVATVFNLTDSELSQRVVEPWRRRAVVTLDGKDMDLGTAEVKIFEGGVIEPKPPLGRSWLDVMQTCTDVTDERLRDRSPAPSSSVEGSAPQLNAKTIMVVHGRDAAARNAMFDFLRALGLEPLEWEKAIAATGNATPSTKEAVDAAFAIAQAVVVLVTPDDEIRLHADLGRAPHEDAFEMQARPNVYIELGMAFALHPQRTVIVEIGQLRRASDLDGMNTVRITKGRVEPLQAIASRLKTAHVEVQTDSSSDWLDVERFADLPTFERRALGAHPVDGRAESISIVHDAAGRQPSSPAPDRNQASLVSAVTRYHEQANEIIYQIHNNSSAMIYDVRWFHETGQGSWTRSPDPLVLGAGEKHAETVTSAVLNRVVEPGVISGFLFRDNAGVNWIKWGDAVLEQQLGDGGEQITGRRRRT